MAYIPMVQDVIKAMNAFDKNDIFSYQKLMKLFHNLFINEQEFLKDPADRMGLSHFVENFLRTNNFQTIITIKDLNLIFNCNNSYDIMDIELYKVFFVLIYEELSSNDPQISYKIKESISLLINLIENNIKEEKEKINNIQENNIIKSIHTSNKVLTHIKNKKKQKIVTTTTNTLNTFIIHNKDYLYEYIRRKNILPYKCSICNLNEWQGEPLKLELDSLDGVYNNLNIENLRFLCPNCYSQVGY